MEDRRRTAARRPVVHPGPTVGYRIEENGRRVAYLPDHEPALGTATSRASPDWISGGDARRRTPTCCSTTPSTPRTSTRTRVGWGHSSVADAVAFARRGRGRRLVLFHHDPIHSDEIMEQLEAEARSIESKTEDPPVVAREGMVLDLPSS